MSTTTTAITYPSGGMPASAPRLDVVVRDDFIVPGWINCLEDYRRWAESDHYPKTGWVSYLDGKIWVDPDMEKFLTHNQINQAFNVWFGVFLANRPIGRFVPDRMLLVNVAANLSTEPDGLFFRWDTMKSGRLTPVASKSEDFMELEGTPDLVLEVISDSSETKDGKVLPGLYWQAGVLEYWLVDARKDKIRFDILVHSESGFQPAPVDDGWVRSSLLGRTLRIERSTDPLGMAQFTVQMKD